MRAEIKKRLKDHSRKNGSEQKYWVMDLQECSWGWLGRFPCQLLVSVGEELQAPGPISQSWEKTNPRVCSLWVGCIAGLQSEGFQVFFSFQVHWYPPFSQSISPFYYFTLKCFMPFSIFLSLISKDQESNNDFLNSLQHGDRNTMKMDKVISLEKFKLSISCEVNNL